MMGSVAANLCCVDIREKADDIRHGRRRRRAAEIPGQRRVAGDGIPPHHKDVPMLGLSPAALALRLALRGRSGATVLFEVGEAAGLRALSRAGVQRAVGVSRAIPDEPNSGPFVRRAGFSYGLVVKPAEHLDEEPASARIR